MKTLDNKRNKRISKRYPFVIKKHIRLKKVIFRHIDNSVMRDKLVTRRSGTVMILEYKVNDMHVQAAWLKTLYDLVEELNCKCQTYIDESYNRSNKNFDRMRTIKIYGSDTMLGWFKLRMERYSHFIFNFNEQPDIKSSFVE